MGESRQIIFIVLVAVGLGSAFLDGTTMFMQMSGLETDPLLDLPGVVPKPPDNLNCQECIVWASNVSYMINSTGT